MEQNPNNQDQLIIKKCPMCGKEYRCGTEYPKKKRSCDKCFALLMRKEQYERLEMDKNLNAIQNAAKKRIENEKNVPKCPTCGSTNVNKISTAKKAAGFVAVGVFSSNFGKTMECKNCGYKW